MILFSQNAIFKLGSKLNAGNTVHYDDEIVDI